MNTNNASGLAGAIAGHDFSRGKAGPRYLTTITGGPDIEIVFLNTFWGESAKAAKPKKH